MELNSDLMHTASAPAVRVRFCPSPTGTPHVGLIRTALFNWAYARHTGGTFVLRIEDTDPARDSEESVRQLLDALDWLGLDWDEGVGKGGQYGPYRQSERMELYADVAAKLVAGGFAYESYSTPEEVEARHVAGGRDAKTGYDGFDRNLTAEQRAAYRAEGRTPVLRLRMPDEDIEFTDLVRGKVVFPAGSVPDYAIVRASGHPLYTLVNPVDDALMRITHVLRGEDLLSSTPRQIALYRALVELGLAERVPQFGHLPYVMGRGNRKLSKRDPESSLFLLREQGFIPEGLDNYLGLLGWSIGPDRDVFALSEMAERFDIAHVSPNPARFDLDKAKAINAAHIRALDPGDFAERIVPIMHSAGLVSAPTMPALALKERRILTEAAPLIRERTVLLGDVPTQLSFFFTPDDAVPYQDSALASLGGDAAQVLAAAQAVLEAEPADLDAPSLQQVLRAALVDGLGIRPKVAFAPIRVALTGRTVSPPLFESMLILGRPSCQTRLRTLSTHLA
ncbi:MAG: glutamate--tRNA ligase [Bifidobacteriaceae bacterium]|jgi:glutamyl-tRNA synthetase|nr:glutamate--tRNA ligase [Bifidobacteriaceae bacterium]